MQTKKRKKKVAAPAHEEQSPPSGKLTGSSTQAVSKKAKGKGKKKDEKDDLDKALEELSIKYVMSVLVFLSVVSYIKL